MARPKQPIALIEANGRSHHLTKAEKEKRRAEEISVDLLDVKPPEYLSEPLQEEFSEIAKKLLHIGIFTELDEDVLARYVIAKKQHIIYTDLLNQAIANKDTKSASAFSSMQDRAFKQCRMCGNDLGLSITSRCNLAIPQVEVVDKVNKFEKFK